MWQHNESHGPSEYSPAPPPPLARRASPHRRAFLGRSVARALVAVAAGAGVTMAALATTSGSLPAIASSSGTGARATSSSSTVAASPTGSSQVWASRQHFMLGLGQAGTLGPNVVRGTLIVKGADGKYETLSVQKGTAHQVGSGHMTVNSADGVSRTYDVVSSTAVRADGDSISSVKDNDVVSVLASVNGSAYTAERIIDLTEVTPTGTGLGIGYTAGGGGAGHHGR